MVVQLSQTMGNFAITPDAELKCPACRQNEPFTLAKVIQHYLTHHCRGNKRAKDGNNNNSKS